MHNPVEFGNNTRELFKNYKQLLFAINESPVWKENIVDELVFYYIRQNK